MLHVFVETNWVVGCTAPAHNKVPGAVDLLDRAKHGEIQLHLPAICLAEARHPLSANFQPRRTADQVRQFVRWAESTTQLTAQHAEILRQGVDLMEHLVRGDLQKMEGTLRVLSAAPGLDVFPLDAQMLARSTQLCFELPELKPYDLSVLAAVLVRADELVKTGERELVFCELDSDLQPWGKRGADKPKLAELYDFANVRVYGDFLLQAPKIPSGSHQRKAAEAD